MSYGKCAAIYKLARIIQRNLELRVTFALEQVATVLRGSIGRLHPYSFFILGARLVWEVQDKPRPPLTPGKRHGTDLQEADLTPGPVSKGAEYLAFIGIRSPDCPARSESQYRLSYRGSQSNGFIE
jgi:hypothetical protein